MGQIRNELRAVIEGETFTLAGYDPAATPFVDSKSDAKDELKELRSDLFDLHELMYAHEDRSTLLVLQGTDASGKNGTIKHVISALNPAGVSVTSFDEPDDVEQEHHFLWRIEQAVPEPGHLAVFNRSHYEDLLVPMAEGTLDAEEVDQRFDDVLAFERKLVDGGVAIVKCLLHLSYDEQRERFLRRLRRHDKRWKFNAADLETRRRWDDYQAAYGEVVRRTSTDDAPWYVIPADHKWYRNWAIAQILRETWSGWDLDYPEPDLDIEALRKALEEPR